MRRIAILLGMLLLLAAGTVPASAADSLYGTVKLGGIIKDEVAGDMSAIQETANIYEGFVVSRVKLDGRLGERNLFHLDLEEINQESAAGLFRYRVPDAGALTVRYDRHRQLYDAAGSVSSMREDWGIDARITPSDWLRLNLDYGMQDRDGSRIGFPQGSPASGLGTGYDYSLRRGRVEAEARRDGRAVALSYDFNKFNDHDVAVAERRGRVFSLRANSPCALAPDLLTHNVRASYGRQELVVTGEENKVMAFEYLGIVRPHRAWDVRYRFGYSRTDNSVTTWKTDLIRNDVDVTWYHGAGNLFGGAGYVTNDDDRSLTKYEVWRVGGRYAVPGVVKVKATYATSSKTDEQQRTLLQDIEASRFKVSLQTNLNSPFTVGASYAEREREFPMLGVEAQGRRTTAFGRVVYPGWGSFNVDYSYADDEYQDLVGNFRADNSTVSARVDLDYIEDLRLSAGVTYLDIGQDLDIEKSILSFEGQYDLLDDWFVEAKYNVYNYDDYILLDRYYTANVVWLNVGYRLSVD